MFSKYWKSKEFFYACMLAICLLNPARAQAEPCEKGPSTKSLIAWGSLMAVADYLVGVTLHEGSHAAAMKIFDGEVTKLTILPYWDEKGNFFFGYTKGHKHGECAIQFEDEYGHPQTAEVPCPFAKHERAVIMAAPKITNLILMGSYVGMFEADLLPKNKYGRLALTVVATGAWVDFSKDIFATNKARDIPKFYNAIGAETEGERLKYRLLHGALSLGAAVEIGRGYYSIFKNDRHPSASKPKNSKPAKDGQLVDSYPVLSPSFIGWGGTFH